jgi:hypothetical protein
MAGFGAFGGVFWLKSVESHTGGAVIKLVAAFRSRNPKMYTVSQDENSHLALFSSFRQPVYHLMGDIISHIRCNE